MSTARRPTRTLVGAVVACLVLLGTAACDTLPPMPPGGTAPDCSDVRWGSTPETATPMSAAPVTDVRAGEHRCFDRVVVDLREPPAPGWTVRYVEHVREPGSGDVVPLRGGARLEVIARAPAHDTDLVPTYAPDVPSEAVDVAGFRTFRQVAFAGSFEGQTHLGLGVRARLPFRAFALDDADGARVVVDVAHRWG